MIDDGEPRPTRAVVVRPMEAGDLDAADAVMRLAFGTFVGLVRPSEMFGDAQYVRPRFAAAPGWAFVAEIDGEVVGSNFATRWGSFGSFGPLTVRPDLWDRKIAVALMGPIVELLDSWNVRQAGLHTFAQSAKHVGLYQKFGFWPQYLTAIMAKPTVGAVGGTEWARFSAIPADNSSAVLDDCAELTGAIFDGLDLATIAPSLLVRSSTASTWPTRS
ncbi:MAG: GNAT family N-acetyltransferase [Actinobacteria bacterium]|nr:GNAT family N-acetyltransferase [Actinomycetota bacterium]